MDAGRENRENRRKKEREGKGGAPRFVLRGPINQTLGGLFFQITSLITGNTDNDLQHYVWEGKGPTTPPHEFT